MHQEVYDWAAPGGGYGRSTRSRCGARGSGGAAAGATALGLSVLTSDPLIELVYRTGLVSLKDLRALMGCTGSPAIRGVAQERARRRLCSAAGTLRGMRGAFELCEAQVRGLALDAEARLQQLGVPMNAGEHTRPLAGSLAGGGSCRWDGGWWHGVAWLCVWHTGGAVAPVCLAAAGAGAAATAAALWDANTPQPAALPVV